MTVFEILHKLILGPVELLFDVIFSCSMQFTGSAVESIVVLSLAVNLLVLPLYRKADALQREEQEISKRLKPRIDQIKEAFTGDERFMMLQTYYRQNNYRPYYVLRGSLSLLLQIPFFMAAYNFLSNLEVLWGTSLGPITSLAKPDGLLTVARITINVLPILMTLINIISGIIYTKGMTLKSKIQLYGMALLFLVLLYDSPAGLVFYWTLNNLFSLVKNIVTKLRDRIRSEHPVRKIEKTIERTGSTKDKRLHIVFYASVILLTILTGLLIPSAVIQDSPAEFVELNAFRSPLIFVLHAFLLAAGTFLIWCVIYYLLAEERRRPVFSIVFAFLAIGAVVDYMFFGNGYGNMSSCLVYDVEVRDSVTSGQILLNAGVLLLVAGIVFFLCRKKVVLLQGICVLSVLVIAGMSLVNILSVGGKIPEIQRLAAQQKSDQERIIQLDKTGMNVVVLMLDRAVGYFAPFIFEEKPELKDQFTGFVCYPNTVSYGNATHNGSPALFGGYEYTPANLAKRNEDTLRVKQNEALRLMPLTFLEEGYEVTVCDPPLSNYSFIPDLTVYEDVPEIHAYIIEGTYPGSSGDESMEGIEKRNSLRERNFFCYSIFRASPVVLHQKLYEHGNYNKTDREELQDFIYFDAYQVMDRLPEMTSIQAEGGNHFLMMTSLLTHQAQLLQEPEYQPAENVDNTRYDLEHPSRFSSDGRELVFTTDVQEKHYHVNMAAMLLIGKWLDYLREEGVYDNTRIILVADHGMIFEFPGLWSEEMQLDLTYYNPLLMVKDFDSQGTFAFSNEFMTNADTPTLAFGGLVDDPKNPATGISVKNQDKQNDEQIICFARGDFDGTVESFFPNARFYVMKNQEVMNLDNWHLEEKGQ